MPPSAALRVPLADHARRRRSQRVSLKETIAIALENNPGIAARRLEPTRCRSRACSARRAQFDPDVRAASCNYAPERDPERERARRRALHAGRRSLRQLPPRASCCRTGTQLTRRLPERPPRQQRSFNQLRPQYSPQLGFSVVQPLLRDFGWDFSYLVVRVAEQTADAAVYQYEANLADFVDAGDRRLLERGAHAREPRGAARVEGARRPDRRRRTRPASASDCWRRSRCSRRRPTRRSARRR